jgi:hypothetical protein
MTINNPSSPPVSPPTYFATRTPRARARDVALLGVAPKSHVPATRLFMRDCGVSLAMLTSARRVVRLSSTTQMGRHR